MADPKNMKFEDAMQQLEGLVTQLEKGDMSLDDALSAFEKGVQLHDQCQKKLREAELRVEKVIAGGEGAPKTEPFDPEV